MSLLGEKNGNLIIFIKLSDYLNIVNKVCVFKYQQSLELLITIQI